MNKVSLSNLDFYTKRLAFGSKTGDKSKEYTDKFENIFKFACFDGVDEDKVYSYFDNLSKESDDVKKDVMLKNMPKVSLNFYEMPMIQSVASIKDIPALESCVKIIEELFDKGVLSKNDLTKLLNNDTNDFFANPYFIAAKSCNQDLANSILGLVKEMPPVEQAKFYNTSCVVRNQEALSIEYAFKKRSMLTELQSPYLEQFYNAKKEFEKSYPEFKDFDKRISSQEACARCGIDYKSVKEKIEHKKYSLDLKRQYGYQEKGYWMGTNHHQDRISPWKIHLYSIDESDWEKLSSVVLPYLNNNMMVAHKTFSSDTLPEDLKDSNQEGKAITIYPSSIAQFKLIANDLDNLIKKANLEIEDSNIIGDKQLGSTGRIFYRYAAQSKEQADLPYTSEFYEENRGGKLYMAQDMTENDDPFIGLLT